MLGACSLLVTTSDLADGTTPGAEAAAAADGDAFADAFADAPADATEEPDGDGSTLSARYVAAVLADDPIAYLRLEEATGAQFATNETAGAPGTYGASVHFGVAGAFAGSRAIETDGTSKGAVSLGVIAGLDGSKPFTFELWYRPNAVDQKFRFLASKYESFDGGLESFGVYTQSTAAMVAERYVASVDVLGSVPVPQLGVFHYVVGTYDGSFVSLFVDGVRVVHQTDLRPSPSKNPIVTFGAFNADGDSVNGAIDEVAVYAKALTAAQVAAHYTASGR
ncbi:MAG: Autotransporter adhesin [Labilithrix sp.]|nr:Autotransporter adhesin [Labilithrix sp.]